MDSYRKRLRINIFLLSLCFLSCTIAQDKETEIATIADKIGAPAIQLVHVKDGKEKHYEYGLKKYGEIYEIDRQTIFQAASLTKVLAAYTFFLFYDEGLIDLDTPLYSYYTYDRLANTRERDRMTARMVLTHRTGLMNWEGNVGTESWLETPLTTLFEPGMDYTYSGEGYYFLQRVLEHIAGRLFHEIVEERVLKPLDMNNSSMVWQDGFEKNCAWGHTDSTTPRPRLGKYYPANAAYSLFTTATDYSKFIQQVLVQGSGLKASTHKLMMSKAGEARKRIGSESEDDHYVPVALGPRMQVNEKGTAYWHTGSNPGFRCFFIVYPDTGESLAAFNNSDTGMDGMKYLMELFLDEQKFWAYDWRQGELD